MSILQGDFNLKFKLKMFQLSFGQLKSIILRVLHKFYVQTDLWILLFLIFSFFLAVCTSAAVCAMQSHVQVGFCKLLIS